ncbi:MAG: hypothetical protein OEZ02_07120 [Anaerolineae bacterium]|nr:hypothetical protein [Anaerolineae bacterium]
MTTKDVKSFVPWKGFAHFMRFEIEQHFWQMRWLLPLPVMLIVAYIVVGDVAVDSLNYSLESNTWDALFSVFGNANLVFFVFTLLFLYLVSDLLRETRFGEGVLFRLGSRRLWWLGKTLTLGLAVVVYLSVAVGIIAGIAGFVLPWQPGWSQATMQLPLEFYVAPGARDIPPAAALGQLLLLLSMGWFCIGLAVMVIAQFSNQLVIGFLTGILVNLSGLMAERADTGPPIAYVSIHQHLLYYYHSFGDPKSVYPAWIVSVLYWALWVGLFYRVGLILSAKQDFLAQEERQ